MTRRLISTGSPFEAKLGYSRAVVQGDWCFVSGITGYDYATMTLPESVSEQASNCFNTLRDVLKTANFDFGTIVRVKHLLTDRVHLSSLAPVLETELGEVRPAATMIITQLMEPEMFYELEVTAYRGT